MANIYVRSGDGNNADSGATWALAKADLAGADATPDAAGDQIYLSDNHSESTNASLSFALAGTLASPSRVVCVDDTGDPSPPTTTATTAIIATGNGAYNITLGGVVQYFGVTFRLGVGGSSNINISLANTDQSYIQARNCVFEVATTGSGSRIRIGDTGASIESRVDMFDCQVKFAQASQGIEPRGARWHWNGGGIASGGTAPTSTLITLSHTIFYALLENLDLSGMGSACNIFTAAAVGSGDGIIRNCRLPASWTGSLVGSVTGVNTRFLMHNCDSGDTNYRLWVEDYAGSIKSETTIVRTGGASDGTTPLAWKMATSANAEWPQIRLVSPEIVKWNETTGSSLTATIEIVHDSQGAGSGSKFQDDEIWLEIQYLGTSGYPQGSDASDAKVALSTAANQTDSSETWTTTGLTTPVKQKLSVTFTPQEKGFVQARVVMAKASKTCYVCPKMTIA